MRFSLWCPLLIVMLIILWVFPTPPPACVWQPFNAAQHESLTLLRMTCVPSRRVAIAFVDETMQLPLRATFVVSAIGQTRVVARRYAVLLNVCVCDAMHDNMIRCAP